MQRIFRLTITTLLTAALAMTTGCETDDSQTAQQAENRHQLVDSLLAEGKQLRENSLFIEAIDCMKKAYQLAKEGDDTLQQVQVLNSMGTNYRRIGALNEATERHTLALILGQQMDYEHNEKAMKARVVALNGLGNIFITTNNTGLADSVLRLALRGEQQLGSSLGQAINYANLGAIKEQKGELDSAWVFYRLSMQKNEECQSKVGIGLCHNHFGSLYEKQGQLEKALEEYTKADEIMAGVTDEWHQLEARFNIARVKMLQGHYDEARQMLLQANETARQIGSIEHRAEAHRQLFQLCLSQKNYQQALSHYERAVELEDSVVDTKKLLEIQNTHMRMERNASERERERASQHLLEERHLRQIATVAAIVITLLSVVLIALLWYALHLRNVKQKVTRATQKARETFFTNVTHEFRTPLTVILGLGHQLEDDEVEDLGQVRSAAKMIVRQGNSLLGLINQLLDISKVRSAAGEPKWRHGNLVAYVMMCVENYRPYADSKRIELTFSHSLTSIETDFVPDYVQKIVSNLLSNAIKYTPKYGKVNLTLEPTAGNRLKMQMFDTGCGISAETLPHVFEPFYQGENATKEIGTGIGLSLVRLMTEAMGGTVQVQSIVGQGSTFTVMLPIAKRDGVPLLGEEAPTLAETMVPQTEEQAPPQATTGTGNGQQRRILIVEDNQDIAYYIGMHMEESSQLIYARTGEEAMQKALETVPDIVITDIMMPGGIDGLELCRQIRQSELLAHVPIIIITAKTSENDRVKGLKAGADAYLVKPFNSEELLIRVNKLLERQRLMRERFAQLPPDATQKEEQMSKDDLQFMGRVADNVYKMMAQGKTDVETLADEMALSRSQLNRRILAITGQNASVYMMRLRLARAKRLLKGDPQMPISDVALKCGFDDVAYFSRIFRQHFDMTPSQYRKIE